MRTSDIADKSQELKEQAQNWQQTAKEQAGRAREVAQQFVQENTWSSVAIAAGVGCILGFLIAKLSD